MSTRRGPSSTQSDTISGCPATDLRLYGVAHGLSFRGDVKSSKQASRCFAFSIAGRQANGESHSRSSVGFASAPPPLVLGVDGWWRSRRCMTAGGHRWSVRDEGNSAVFLPVCGEPRDWESWSPSPERGLHPVVPPSWKVGEAAGRGCRSGACGQSSPFLTAGDEEKRLERTRKTAGPESLCRPDPRATSPKRSTSRASMSWLWRVARYL